MWETEAEKIKNKVKELFLRANYHIGGDVLAALKEAQKKRFQKLVVRCLIC